MRLRGKRSLDITDSSPVHPLRRGGENNNTDGLSQRMHRTQTPKEITRSLLQTCMDTLSDGIWWRILPLEDGNDDISVGMGIDWEDLLPLLIHDGLLYSTKRSTACDYRVSRDSWHSLTVLSEGKLQVGSFTHNHIIHGKRTNCRQFFICNGKPICKSPTQQLQELKNGNYDYLRVKYAGSLKRNVSSHADTIIRTNYLERVAATTATATATSTAAAATTALARITTAGPTVETQLVSALTLNLGRRPRMNRKEITQIVVHDRKQARQVEIMMILSTAKLWGWLDPMLESRRRVRIARAACRQVAYDHGYERPITHSMIMVWEETLCDTVAHGSTNVANDVLSPQVGGSKLYLDSIEGMHHLYLHELFRYAQRIRGGKESFKVLADTMNEKSGAPGEVRTTLHISRRQLMVWFYKNNGTQRSPVEKPLDTDEHKQLRLKWVALYYNLFIDPTIPMGHLDEKFFYVTNRRRQIKMLPIKDGEPPGSNSVVQPKMRNRRYPVKVMFMGVVANPIPSRNFSGKIHLERISKTKTTTAMSHHQRFSDDINVNRLIKRGGWKAVVDIEFTTYKNALLVGEFYDLEDAVIDTLVFAYRPFSGDDGNKTLKYLTYTDTIGGTMYRNKSTSHYQRC